MSSIPRGRAAVALGLILWLSVASGCSWCRSVGDYYGSSRWHEDLEEAAAAVLVVGFVMAVGIGIVILGSQDGVDLRGMSFGGHPAWGGSAGRGRSPGYGWSDYYRTMSR